MNRERIPASTAIGAVHLTVSDLARASEFYISRLGMRPLSRDGSTARLGAGARTLLVLTGDPAARRVHGTTGLFHFAVLVPSRAHLGRALAQLVSTHTALEGVADHGVSEALYLHDPDSNGVELYWDRPEAEWPRTADGQLAMHTKPLGLDSLLAEAQAGA